MADDDKLDAGFQEGYSLPCGGYFACEIATTIPSIKSTNYPISCEGILGLTLRGTPESLYHRE